MTARDVKIKTILWQVSEGLDLGDQVNQSLRYVVDLQPESVKQLRFLHSVLAPTLRRYFKIFSALPRLIVSQDIDELAFNEGVVGVAPHDVSLVVDALLFLGILRVDESNFLQLGDDWNSAEMVENLSIEMSKFVTL